MDGFDFPVEVVRTNRRRRSVSIQLDDGVIRVRVPRFLSERRIREIIVRRTAWIKTRLMEEAQRPKAKPKEYVSGEAFSYLGRNYRLKVLKNGAPSIKLEGGYFRTTVPETDEAPAATVRSLLVSWYRDHAVRRLREKTARLSKIVGVEPKSVTVREYKSRWGSCSVHGDISYNWRIILASHRIIDYVIVHELCHLLEHNHSPRYWKHVERYVPDWRECRNWLRDHPLIL